MQPQVLVIDADENFTQPLSEFLSHDGFEIHHAADGETGIKKALSLSVDLIILDINLPKINGLEVLRRIRAQSNTPVIMLTGATEDASQMVSFELGADDYVAKPSNPQELGARIKTILRRTQKNPVVKPVIERHNLIVDCSKRSVMQSGKPLELTNTEFNILELLIKSPGQAFSKEELTEYALGRKFTAFDRSIDVHISNLRNKLGDNPAGEPILKTVRGFGYLFNA